MQRRTFNRYYSGYTRTFLSPDGRSIPLDGSIAFPRSNNTTVQHYHYIDNNISYHYTPSHIVRMGFGQYDFMVEEMYHCPPSATLYIPSHHVLILVCIDPRSYDTAIITWRPHGSKSLRVPSRNLYYFYAVLFAGSSRSDGYRLRLFNSSYVENMLNQHYPHKSRSRVRATARAMSLPVSSRLRQFALDGYRFAYY